MSPVAWCDTNVSKTRKAGVLLCFFREYTKRKRYVKEPSQWHWVFCMGSDIINGCWTKNNGKTPQIIHFNRVFSIINDPFWGVFPLFLGWHPNDLYKQKRYLHLLLMTMPKTSRPWLPQANKFSWNGRIPKGTVLVFQPSIFRGENVSFREGKWYKPTVSTILHPCEAVGSPAFSYRASCHTKSAAAPSHWRSRSRTLMLVFQPFASLRSSRGTTGGRPHWYTLYAGFLGYDCTPKGASAPEFTILHHGQVSFSSNPRLIKSINQAPL